MNDETTAALAVTNAAGLQQENVATVETILAYYQDEVSPALALAHSSFNAFPEEVLNEIRASFTHLARANALGVDHVDHQSELDAAFRHLKRTCLDSFKLIIFKIAKTLDEHVTVLHEELVLPNSVWQKLSKIRAKRKALGTQEAQAPTHVAVDEYKLLAIEYDGLLTEINDEYLGETALERQKIVDRNRSRDRAVGLLLGILGSAVVSLVVWFLTKG